MRAAYPELPLCFSISAQFDTVLAEDVSHYDLLEPHVWMVLAGPRRFYEELDYDGRDPAQYELLADEAERLYRSSPDEWRIQLSNMITDMADWSRWRNLPLVTTESWAIVCWKDGPGLDWGWVRDLCEFGVDEAIKHGRWMGIATSNFCGPQYTGDVGRRRLAPPADVAHPRRTRSTTRGGGPGWGSRRVGNRPNSGVNSR